MNVRNEATKAPPLIRVLCIGDTAVGKSCLIQQYLYGDSSDMHVATLTCEMRSKLISVDDTTYLLQVLDFPGQSQYHQLCIPRYSQGMAVMLVYDVTRRSTLENLVVWHKQMKQFIDENPGKFPKVNPLKNAMLIANKGDVGVDNGRMVTMEEGLQFADRLGIPFYCETSASFDANVKEAFNSLIVITKEAVYSPRRRQTMVFKLNGARDGGDVRQIAKAVQPVVRRSGPRRGKGLFLAIAASLLPDRSVEPVHAPPDNHEFESTLLEQPPVAQRRCDMAHCARLTYFAFAFFSIIALWIPWYARWNGPYTSLRKIAQFTQWVVVLSLIYFGQLCYVLLLVNRMKALPEVASVPHISSDSIDYAERRSLSRNHSSQIPSIKVDSREHSDSIGPALEHKENEHETDSDVDPSTVQSIFDSEIVYPPRQLEPLFTENETSQTNRLMNRIVIHLRRSTRLFSVSYTITMTWMVIFFTFVLPNSEYFKTKYHRLNRECVRFPQLCEDPLNLAVEILLVILPPTYMIGQVFVLPAASSFDPSLQDLGISILFLVVYILQSWIMFAFVDAWPYFRQRAVYEYVGKSAGLATLFQLAVIIPVQIVLYFGIRLVIQWLRRYQTWRTSADPTIANSFNLPNSVNAESANGQQNMGTQDYNMGYGHERDLSREVVGEYYPPKFSGVEERVLSSTQGLNSSGMIAMADLGGRSQTVLTHNVTFADQKLPQNDGGNSSSNDNSAATLKYPELPRSEDAEGNTKSKHENDQMARSRAESYNFDTSFIATSVSLATNVGSVPNDGSYTGSHRRPEGLLADRGYDQQSLSERQSKLNQLIGVGIDQSDDAFDTYDY